MHDNRTRMQSELDAEAIRLGLSPVIHHQADPRVTGDQLETFERDLNEHPDDVGLLGFNDAGWLVYRIGEATVSVAPDGEAYTGRDAHLRRFQDV